MSDRKLAKAIQRLFRSFWTLYRTLTKGLVTWLLRTAMLAHRRRRPAAGFVLPTTIFLILVVALSAGALSYRAYNNSVRTIGEVQSRAIYNAATPAIDRARSKLDYLFGKDPRLTSGVPAEEFMVSMMLNDGRAVGTAPGVAARTVPGDPYTLADETRVNINGDAYLDNAWVYKDPNTNSSIIYSINLSTPDQTTANPLGAKQLLQLSDQVKATGDNSGSFVRSGPLSNSEAVGCRVSTSASTIENGWYQDSTNTSILRKRFQIDAFVVKDEDVKAGKPSTFTTLEFAQDRKLDRGNKWGAWFKNDLEVYSGTPMNWNGAMHTEGNLMIGKSGFYGYLISSPQSCLFLPESNSEISVRDFSEQNDDSTKKFYGVIASGGIFDGQYGGTAPIDKYNGKGYSAGTTLNIGTQWATGSKPIASLATDPKMLLTEALQQARASDYTNADARIGGAGDPLTVKTDFKGRFSVEKTTTQPYVDDTYRADDRYGPKVQYSNTISVPTGSKMGDVIPTGTTESTELVNNSPNDTSSFGLDGYWERRTLLTNNAKPDDYQGGMRILVGQRLELGNPFGWVAPQNRDDTRQDPSVVPSVPAGEPVADYDDLRKVVNPTTAAPATTPQDADPIVSDNEGDPLYPPYKLTDRTNLSQRAHEARQRRALRDNLAAVQSTAIYHYTVKGGLEPVACLATTAHPGTPATLRESVNFLPIKFNANGAAIQTYTNFFYGKGTNGWEYDTTSLVTNLKNPGSAMGIALQNLANFAGDPDGAYPPTQEQVGAIHPEPTLTMWGNFSNLRRAMKSLNATGYDALSLADQSYLHTAGCTLGMLANNIEQIQKYDPSSSLNGANQSQLATAIGALMDGDTSNGEVLPQSQLATYGYKQQNDPLAAPAETDKGKYNPRDYDRVTPETLIAALRNTNNNNNDPQDSTLIRLAEMIHLHFQIRRDRTYGFRPSPAPNTWNFNPYLVSYNYTTDPGTGSSQQLTKPTLWSSACDPNVFADGTSEPRGYSGANGYAANPDKMDASRNGTTTRRRLYLSRLCGAVTPSGAVHDFPGDNNFPTRKAADGLDPTVNAKLTLDASTQQEVSYPTKNIEFEDDGTAEHHGVPNAVFQTNPVLNSTAYTGNTTSPSDDPKRNFKRAQVMPEFPSLYYIFPQNEHDHDGEVTTLPSGVVIDHRQPGNGNDAGPGGTPKLVDLPAAFQPWPEPYITNQTVIAANAGLKYQVVNFTDALPAQTVAESDSYTSAVPVTNAPTNHLPDGVTEFNYFAYQPYGQNDKSVDLGISPRASISDWLLPHTAGVPVPNNSLQDNTDTPPPPNLIRTPDKSIAAIPFLDRVMFNGREWLPARVLDIDLSMLRKSGAGNNDAWLPGSGIVYAFREDATREDAIARPTNALGYTNAQTPGSETDPPKDSKFGVSIKSVDYIPDPDRRPYGFRLRNGAILRRDPSVGIPDNKNTKGLSFMTDNPAYIMGNFNIHQTYGLSRIEEFISSQLLPDDPDQYNTSTFYDQRTKTDSQFSDYTKDLWRPSEVLADTVTVITNKFCDGSALDGFMNAGYLPSGAEPPTATLTNSVSSGSDKTSLAYAQVLGDVNGSGAAVYNAQSRGLYAPGCTNGVATSFMNQNLPAQDLTESTTKAWNWVRENPYDPITSPVKISRNGNGFIAPVQVVKSANIVSTNPVLTPYTISLLPILPAASKLPAPIEYSSANDSDIKGSYNSENDSGQNKSRPLQVADSTGNNIMTVNAIMISGIVPSRENQAYGGLQNFPRFLEWWKDQKLRFAGSFLQLNFSNYATAPFDQDRWEPSGTDVSASSTEVNGYYGYAPRRLWGYDVALQMAPASPAAERFTTPSSERNEFYTEPKANDPYMNKLCTALKTTPPAGTDFTKLNCPT